MDNNSNPHLEQIRNFRLLDDDFMKVVFGYDLLPAQTTLRVILGIPDLVVKTVHTENVLHNLQGHSVRLDVYAVDSKGKHYDIEVQRSDRGAGARRARYNMSLLNASILPPSEKYKDLPDTYVVFITENDVFHRGLPLYHIEPVIQELGELFPDGGHIIYANGAYHGDDDIGRLMHDFRTSNPHDMFYEHLKKPAAYFKEDPKGVERMSYIMEEIAKTNYEMGLEQGIERGVVQGIEKENKRIIRMLCQYRKPAQVAEELDMPLDKVILILEAEEG